MTTIASDLICHPLQLLSLAKSSRITMASLAAMESAAFSIISSYPSNSPKFHLFNKPLSYIPLKFPLKLPLISSSQPSKRPSLFPLQSSVESVILEITVQKSPKIIDNRRKLFVLNLPWTFSVVDIKNLFGECGIVSDVEIIKQKSGKSRGFAFVTMGCGEEAQAVIEKFDSHELAGRKITIQIAKRFKRPRPAPPANLPPGETRHRLYVSNLAWKVRSNNLRELFASESNPVSARVVFDTGKSAGYGFVSFATKEEAESAISLFEGKELLGRPIHLQLSDKNNDSSEIKEEISTEQQPGNSQITEDSTTLEG